MALATTLFPGEPGGALATLLSQGVSALNQAVTNAINVGRDRATTQLNQESTLFNVLKNEKDLEFRKATELRRNFETDRLFGRAVARDVREDFTKDRDFYEDVFNADRSYLLSKTAANRAEEAAKRTSDHYTTVEQQRAQELELKAQTTGAALLRTQEEQRQTDILREQQNVLQEKAMGPTGNLISDPLQLSTITTPELENYVDIFSPVTTPQVQGRVSAARRELARRNPDVDPQTGKRIPDKFSPDRSNPYLDKKTPAEVQAVTQNLKDQIEDIDALIEVARAKGKTNTGLASLIKTRAELIEQLNKGPEAALATSSKPSDTTSAAAFLDTLNAK